MYEVAYTPKGSKYPRGTDRVFEDYRFKQVALNRAERLKEEGATEIFVDVYEPSKGLVDYITVSSRP